MKIEIRINERCISFGPEINQHIYVQVLFTELSLKDSFWITNYCSEQLSKSYRKFMKRMKLK